MKTIGLIGGLSWESTSQYYRIINEEVRKKCGGLHSAKCIIHSVNFAEVEECQRKGDWDKAGDILIEAARGLEKGGADFFLICANTMHKVACQVQAAVSIPLLHIADAAAARIKPLNITTIGLIGTRYTMEEDFYISRLEQKGFNIIVPDKNDREIINHVIFYELCLGQIHKASKDKYLEVIQKLVDRGARGVILGCTEITLLVNGDDSKVPLFDTTLIHAAEAVRTAIDN